jgi:hypothetical protein
MDCINEAKKFIRRAQEASTPEVIHQHLAMADWYLSEAVKQQGGSEEPQPKKGNPGARSSRA